MNLEEENERLRARVAELESTLIRQDRVVLKDGVPEQALVRFWAKVAFLDGLLGGLAAIGGFLVVGLWCRLLGIHAWYQTYREFKVPYYWARERCLFCKAAKVKP